MRQKMIWTVWVILLLTGCSLIPAGNDSPPTIMPTGTPVGTDTPVLPTKVGGGTVTQTPEATATAPEMATATSVPEIPLEATPVPTATELPEPRYAIQPGTPLGVTNFAFPEAGCNWMGIGGQAFDISGNPVPALVIEVGGSLGSDTISQYVLSGATSAFGPGGFGVQLANKPVASDGSLWVQLFDISARPLTERFYFTTYPDCERNLILINFSEVLVNLQPRVFLPSILREPGEATTP